MIENNGTQGGVSLDTFKAFLSGLQHRDAVNMIKNMILNGELSDWNYSLLADWTAWELIAISEVTFRGIEVSCLVPAALEDSSNLEQWHEGHRRCRETMLLLAKRLKELTVDNRERLAYLLSFSYRFTVNLQKALDAKDRAGQCLN